MRKVFAVLFYVALIIIPIGMVYYLVSSGIIYLFGDKVFTIVLLVVGTVVIFRRLFKKLK